MEEGIATLSSFSSDARQAAIAQQLETVDLATKDKDAAFLIELLPGLFGLLGIGYMYTGLMGPGLVRLFGYWVFLTVMWGAFLVFSTVTFGLGACLFFIPLVIQFIPPVLSAYDLRKSMERVKGIGGGSASGGGVGGYIPDRPASLDPDPMQELQSDLYPGIERELEEDRRERGGYAAPPAPPAPPAASGARSYPDAPPEEPGESAERQL